MRGFFRNIHLETIAHSTFFFILLAYLVPQISIGQGQLINGNRTIVGTLNFCDAVGSTGDAYVCALDPAIAQYFTGVRYTFKAPNASTAAGGTTLNLNAVGAKTIVKVVGGLATALADNDIRAGQYVEVVYDSTADNFQMQSTLGNAPTPSAASETVAGIVELATASETTTGTSQALAVHPQGLASSTVVRSIYIPAGNFDVNGSCALGAAAVLLTSGPKTVSITCTDSTSDSIETLWTMPDGWNAGTFTVELNAFNVGTNASTLIYEISWIAKCVGSTEAPGTWAAVNHSTDVATSLSLTTTDNLIYHATSAALTPVGGCAAGDTVFLKGEIDATATTMTPMTDLKILGVKVEYTRSRGND